MDSLVEVLPIATAQAGERVPPAVAAADPANRDLRFDMRQDGRTMSADEFEIRTLPLPDALRWLRENSEPVDPRDDIDTESLRRRFPRVGRRKSPSSD